MVREVVAIGLFAAGAGLAPGACPLFVRYGNAWQAVAAPPIGAGSFGVAGDALADGRLLAATGLRLYVETTAGSGAWCEAGVLPFGAEPTFVAVSPSGTRIAVGMNPAIVVFDLSALGSCAGPIPALADVGVVFSVSHYDGVWMDEGRLALSVPGEVLEASVSTDGSVSTRTLVTNIGGASAGVGLDANGNLFTGNGFDLAAGGSETGWIKAFAPSSWAIGPADFENAGVFVGDVLSAVGLRFDGDGNLCVGGGDFGSGDTGYVGVIRSGALHTALGGGGPVNTSDPEQVRRLAPTADPFAFHGVVINRARGEVNATLVDFSTNAATWHRTQGFHVLPGDANGDHKVDFADLNIVLSAFGLTTGGGASAGDLNGDGRVDFADLNLVLGSFGSRC